MSNDNKKKGMKNEDRVQKTLNSGSLWMDKGDLKSDEYVIECKFTEQKGFRVTTKILEKLWNESMDANKMPMLTISIEEDNCRCYLICHVEREAR